MTQREKDFNYSGAIGLLARLHLEYGSTIVEEEINKIEFSKLPIGSTFKLRLVEDSAVCLKITEKTAMTISIYEDSVDMYTTIHVTDNREVYPVYYLKEFERYTPELTETFKIDDKRIIIIKTNGDIELKESTSHSHNNSLSYIRTKKDVQNIIEYGKVNYSTGCGLTPESVVEVGCQKFTVQQIRDFTKVYNSFVDGVVND